MDHHTRNENGKGKGKWKSKDKHTISKISESRISRQENGHIRAFRDVFGLWHKWFGATRTLRNGKLLETIPNTCPADYHCWVCGECCDKGVGPFLKARICCTTCSKRLENTVRDIRRTRPKDDYGWLKGYVHDIALGAAAISEADCVTFVFSPQANKHGPEPHQ